MKRLLALGAAAYLAMVGCSSDPYTVDGKITREDDFQTPMGRVYRVVVEHAEEGGFTSTPFPIIGTDAELDSLNGVFNVGDRILINPNSTVFSMDLETIIFPDHVKKPTE